MHIATKGSKIDVSSEKKLEELAKKFTVKVNNGDIFYLLGEMGVGKTTFVKYFINNLQSQLNQKITEVNSPTFNIMNEYIIGDKIIKHYDLYRINYANELNELNIFGDIEQEIIFIEWPQIIKIKPSKVTEIYFEYKNDYQNRFISFKN